MEPTKVGKHFVYGPTNAVTAAFLPADNVNGAIVQTIVALPKSGKVHIYVGTVAPSSSDDATVPWVFGGYGYATTTVWQGVVLPNPLAIPAGMGVWIASNAAAGGTGLSWDFLS